MKNKKILSILISVTIVVISLCAVFSSFANDVAWRYDSSTKTIYISGNGNMTDYQNEYSTEWSAYMNIIENVVVENGVTSVGDYSFSGASALKNVSLADSVASIGSNAFSSCTKLETLTLSKSITKIADSSFAYDGSVQKTKFCLNVEPASYALSYAVENNVTFSCSSVKCGCYESSIYPAGMTAYFPYTPKADGIFKFYSKSRLDTLGAVYDSDFNELASNDDYDDSNFYIEQKLQKNKTYYIALSLFSSHIAGSYQLYIEPVKYTVDLRICAMKTPKGEPSSILLDGAVVNGVRTDGTITLELSEINEQVDVIYDYASSQFVVSPDVSTVLPLMVCDLNNDNVVNGFDYVMMKKSNSPFLPLFSDFADYKY